MKNKITYLLMISISLSACHASRAEDTTLVIATYSVRSQPMEVALKQRQLLESYKVEIAALQVMDRNTDRNRYDMVATFMQAPYLYAYFSEAMKFMGGSYGISVLSQYPLLSTYEQKLPTSIGKETEEKALLTLLANHTGNDEKAQKRIEKYYEEGLLEPRVYQRVEIEKEGKRIAFYNVHLSFENKEIRTKQIKLLKQKFDQDPCEYKMMAGTFNTDQSTSELDIFTADYQIANGIDGYWLATQPLEDEKMRVFSIDNIVCTNNMTINEVIMEPSNLSNHLPLIAKVTLH